MVRMTQASEPGKGRAQVRGPQHPPTVEEALLDPRLGHVVPDAPSPKHDGALRRLIAAQLRLGLGVGLGFVLLVIGAFLVLETTPWGAVTLFGAPLSWLVPGTVLIPAMLLAGWWYQRAARRHEADFLREGGQ